MRVTREQFTRVMLEYGFARFPRIAGNPGQAVIYPTRKDNGFSTFIQFFRANCGVRPVFTSHNSYYDFDEYGNPANVYYEKHFQDLDTDMGHTLEVAHKDCKKVAEFATEHKMPSGYVFSGEGFHPYLFFKPKLLTLDAKLSRDIKAISLFLKDELKLETTNLVCAEPKRLVRVPLSKYVSKTPNEKGWTVKDNYCTPITKHMLETWKTDEIKEYSKNPMIEECYKEPGNKVSLKWFLREFKIKSRKVIMTPQSELLNGSGQDYTKVASKDFFKMTELLVPLPCISRILWDKNPPHVIRFSACAFLLSVLNRQEAHTFFDKLAHEAKWNDRHNKMIRDYQIDNIYDMGYARYSCKELMNMGFCLGKDCHLYGKYLKENGISDSDD